MSQQDKKERSGSGAVVIWLTGLPCSGKSTIASGLRDALRNMGRRVFILDGDVVRRGLCRDLGFSREDRKENIRRVSEVAKLFVEAGVMVVTAFISPYRQDRDAVRSMFAEGDFLEVHVKADISVCQERDVKGHYKKALAGEIPDFTGVSAPYESPVNPELVLDTQNQDEKKCTSRVMDLLNERNILS